MENFTSFLDDHQHTPSSPNHEDQETLSRLIPTDRYPSHLEEVRNRYFSEDRLRDYAQEIESPYCKQKDAFMSDSDQESEQGSSQRAVFQRQYSGQSQHATPFRLPIMQIANFTTEGVSENTFSKPSFALKQIDTQQITDRRERKLSSFIRDKLQPVLGMSDSSEKNVESLVQEKHIEIEQKIQENEGNKIERELSKNAKSENEATLTNEAEYNSGKWTDEEHKRFLEGLKLFGKNWNSIQKYINSRSCPQTRSHAQKFFRKMQKQGLLKKGVGTNCDQGDLESDSSDEERRRSPKGRRSRLNSIRSDKLKEKLQTSTNILHKLEWEVITMLNNQANSSKCSSPTSPTKQQQLAAPKPSSQSQTVKIQPAQVSPVTSKEETKKAPEPSPKPTKQKAKSVVEQQNSSTPVKSKKSKKLSIIGKRKVKASLLMEKLRKMQSSQKFRKIFTTARSVYKPGEKKRYSASQEEQKDNWDNMKIKVSLEDDPSSESIEEEEDFIIGTHLPDHQISAQQSSRFVETEVIPVLAYHNDLPFKHFANQEIEKDFDIDDSRRKKSMSFNEEVHNPLALRVGGELYTNFDETGPEIGKHLYAEEEGPSYKYQNGYCFMNSKDTFNQY